jgi:hypothetical protein
MVKILAFMGSRGVIDEATPRSFAFVQDEFSPDSLYSEENYHRGVSRSAELTTKPGGAKALPVRGVGLRISNGELEI